MFDRCSRRFHAVRIIAALAVLGIVWAGIAPAQQPSQPKNVILLIGDGMGVGQIEAAGIFAHGKTGSLFMESLPFSAQVVTCPAYSVSPGASATQPAPVTDSAAAATALATGQKVSNSVLSLAIPGDGKPLTSVLEQFAAKGKSTGLVTSSYLLDATPAAFAAHVKERTMAQEIAADFLRLRPNVLLGGGHKDALKADKAAEAGFLVAKDREELAALEAPADGHVLGLFGVGPMCFEYDYQTKARRDYDRYPHLDEMALWALAQLSKNPKGFFVMIESGCIDKACHSSMLPQAIGETLEFDKTIKLVVDWAAGRDDTLIIVVADHETGGLKVLGNNGQGELPEVAWGRPEKNQDHSGANVRAFAKGPGSQAVEGTLDNTDIFRIMTGTFTGPTKYQPKIVNEAATAAATMPATMRATAPAIREPAMAN